MGYTPGITETVTVVFTDGSGNLVDPTTLKFSYTNNGTSYGPFTYASSSTPGVGYVYRVSLGDFAFQIDPTGFQGSIQATFTPTGLGIASIIKTIPQNIGVSSFKFTLSQLTDDLFRQLRGVTRDQVNILAASLDAPAALTTETISFSAALGGVTIGSLLVVGSETMYVLNAYTANNTAQVIRGYDGTTPATATTGTLVQVDPLWTRSIAQQRLRDEIRSWAPQVFTIGAVEIPMVTMQRGYDLAAITNQILRILYVTAPQPPYTGDPGIWYTPGTVDYDQSNPSQPFKYDANANSVEFPSGRSLVLTGKVIPNYTGNLHVVYATPFDVDTSWVETTDMIGDVGMREEDLDIPVLGASGRLLRMLAVRRAVVNPRGQSRDDQNISMATILQAAQKFEIDTKSRLNDAQLRILSDWPYRSSNF